MAIRTSLWQAAFILGLPQLQVIVIAALVIFLFLRRRHPQMPQWRATNWSIFSHYLFVALVLGAGHRRSVPPRSTGDTTGTLLLDGLFYASLLSCVYWVWRLQGFRSIALVAVTVMEAAVFLALFFAGMQVSGDWI